MLRFCRSLRIKRLERFSVALDEFSFLALSSNMPMIYSEMKKLYGELSVVRWTCTLYALVRGFTNTLNFDDGLVRSVGVTLGLPG